MYTDKITQSVAEAVKKVMAEEPSAKQKGIAKIAGDKSKIDSADLSALRSGAKPVKEGWQDMLDDVKKRAQPQPNGGAGKKEGTRYGGSKQKDEPEKKEVKEDISDFHEQAKWRKTSVAKKVTDPDGEDSRSYDYHHDYPRSTGMMKATSDTESKYHSLSARPKAQVASSGARKGMITKQHGERLKARIKSSLANEEVEQIDEKHMTEPQMKKREEIVKSMKKGLAGFKERYGERAKNVMYATATKQAMKD